MIPSWQTYPQKWAGTSQRTTPGKLNSEVVAELEKTCQAEGRARDGVPHLQIKWKQEKEVPSPDYKQDGIHQVDR